MATKSELVSRAVTALQIKNLQSRIDRAASQAKYRAAKQASLAEPASVRAARRLVERFEQRNDRAMTVARDRMAAKVTAARNVILFGGDIQKALKAVEAIEALAGE